MNYNDVITLRDAGLFSDLAYAPIGISDSVNDWGLSGKNKAVTVTTRLWAARALSCRTSTIVQVNACTN